MPENRSGLGGRLNLAGGLCSTGAWHAFPLVFPYANGHFPIQWQSFVSRWGVSSYPVGRMGQVALHGFAAWMRATLCHLRLGAEIRPQHILFNSTGTQIKCFLHEIEELIGSVSFRVLCSSLVLFVPMRSSARFTTGTQVTWQGTSVQENKLLFPFSEHYISKITPPGFRFSQNTVIKKPCTAQWGKRGRQKYFSVA